MRLRPRASKRSSRSGVPQKSTRDCTCGRRVDHLIEFDTALAGLYRGHRIAKFDQNEIDLFCIASNFLCETSSAKLKVGNANAAGGSFSWLNPLLVFRFLARSTRNQGPRGEVKSSNGVEGTSHVLRWLRTLSRDANDPPRAVCTFSVKPVAGSFRAGKHLPLRCTLPMRNAWRSPLSPCDDITMRSRPSSSAVATMASSGCTFSN